MGNVGTLVVFALSGEDAKALAPEFAPVFGPQDLIDLPAHHFNLKLKIDGVTSRPFSAETIAFESNNPADPATIPGLHWFARIAESDEPMATHSHIDVALGRQNSLF